MRAIVMEDFGGPEVLRWTETPDPHPEAGEVRVKVAAVEVSATRDAGTRSGRHPFSRFVSLPHVLGGDCAGTIDAVGAGVDRALVDRRVAVSNAVPCGRCRFCLDDHDGACESLQLVGVHRPGSYAEQVVVPAANARPIPDDLGFAEAAALAADGAIAFAQLEAGDVGDGTRLLVCGAAGALGSTLVTMAAALGAEVTALSRRSPEVLERWGASTVLRSDAPDLAERLQATTEGHGYDVIVDNIALPELVDAYMPALGIRGRVIMSGAMGAKPIAFAPQPFYVRSQAFIGVRTEDRRTRERFWQQVDAGLRLAPDAVEVLPLADAAGAHRRTEAGDKIGHLLLDLPA